MPGRSFSAWRVRARAEIDGAWAKPPRMARARGVPGPAWPGRTTTHQNEYANVARGVDVPACARSIVNDTCTRDGGGVAARTTSRPASIPIEANPMPPQMPRLVQRAHSRSSRGQFTASDPSETVAPMDAVAATMTHPQLRCAGAAGDARRRGRRRRRHALPQGLRTPSDTATASETRRWRLIGGASRRTGVRPAWPRPCVLRDSRRSCT